MNSFCFSSISAPVRARGLAALAFVALFAGACAPVATRPSLPGDERAQADREAALAFRPSWGFRGRVAISQGEQGGQVGIRWRQHASDYDIELSAPITRQSWKLSSGAGLVKLEGLDGGVRTGQDAEALLFEATGWRIPVEAMASWARGARGQGAVDGFASDAAGRPASFRQGGWDIEYRDWFEGSPAMPRRVFARQGEASVRLVVEAWDAP